MLTSNSLCLNSPSSTNLPSCTSFPNSFRGDRILLLYDDADDSDSSPQNLTQLMDDSNVNPVMDRIEVEDLCHQQSEEPFPYKLKYDKQLINHDYSSAHNSFMETSKAHKPKMIHALMVNKGKVMG